MANNRSDIVIGGSPRAELLPPEIKLEERGRAQKRLMAFVVVIVLAVTAGGYVLSVLAAETSKQRLNAANAYTDELIAKQAEYLNVRQLSAQVQASKDAATIGMATDIDWSKYLELVDAAITGSGAYILSSELTAETPLVPLVLPTSPLEQARVAEYTIVVSTIDYPIYANWLDAVAKLPGYADATITLIKLEATGYEATMVLHFTNEVYTNRFAVDADDSAAADDATDADEPTDEETEAPN